MIYEWFDQVQIVFYFGIIGDVMFFRKRIFRMGSFIKFIIADISTVFGVGFMISVALFIFKFRYFLFFLNTEVAGGVVVYCSCKHTVGIGSNRTFSKIRIVIIGENRRPATWNF